MMLQTPPRMTDRSKRPPGEALVDLRRRLALLSPRDPARSEVIARAAAAYGVSVWTIYRALRELTRPKSVRRSDHGSTRAAPAARDGAVRRDHRRTQRLGEKRVSAEVVEQVLSRAIDELEPTLTRNGYDAPALTVLLKAKPAEVRDVLAGTLPGDRTREFAEQLRMAGVPV
jgi:hypothetical protein